VGYSKAKGTTRGSKVWRGYININGKQIVQTFRTAREAKAWSNLMEKKFAEIKNDKDGYDKAVQELRGEVPREWLDLPCGRVEVKREDGDRCEQFGTCERYLECLGKVTRAGFGAWSSPRDKNSL